MEIWVCRSSKRHARCHRTCSGKCAARARHTNCFCRIQRDKQTQQLSPIYSNRQPCANLSHFERLAICGNPRRSNNIYCRAPSTLNASLVSTIPQSGSITLNDGGTPFAVLFAPVINGAAGVAFTTSQLTTGQHAITATFSGNTGFASATSPALAQVVNPAGSPDFSLIPNATSASVSAGQAADFSFNAKSLNGFTGILKFSCGNLPALTTCTFSPATEFVVTAGTNFTTLVVKTTGPHAALVAPALPGNSRGLGAYAALWGWTPFACGIVLLAGFRRKRFGSRAVVLLALISIGILGCGGGGTRCPPPPRWFKQHLPAQAP